MPKIHWTTKLKLYAHTVSTFIYNKKYSQYLPKEYKIIDALVNTFYLSFKVLLVALFMIVFVGLYFGLALLIAALIVFIIGTFTNIVINEDISSLIAIVSFTGSTFISLYILYTKREWVE